MTRESMVEYRDLLQEVEHDKEKTIAEISKELDTLLAKENPYTNFFLPTFNRFN